MKTFLNLIKNNLETLNDFKSIIAISNDIWIEEFVSYGLHKDIVRNPKFNLSLIFLIVLIEVNFLLKNNLFLKL